MAFEIFGKEITLTPACECRIREQKEREKKVRLDDLYCQIREQGLESGRCAAMTLCNWDHRGESCKEAARRLETYLRGVHPGKRNWLYLHGNYGLGKTHLAVASLKYLALNRQWDPLMVRWAEYCSKIQQGWQSNHAELDEYHLWQKAMKTTLLVLDDIDKRASSEWALGKLYELIDYRYIHRMPTILTANRSLEMLTDYWGGKSEQAMDLAHAIVSRIIGQLAVVIGLTGQDRRLEV